MSAEGLAVLATQGVAHCTSLSELHLDCKRGVRVCVCVCARVHVHASMMQRLGSGCERGQVESSCTSCFFAVCVTLCVSSCCM